MKTLGQSAFDAYSEHRKNLTMEFTNNKFNVALEDLIKVYMTQHPELSRERAEKEIKDAIAVTQDEIKILLSIVRSELEPDPRQAHTADPREAKPL